MNTCPKCGAEAYAFQRWKCFSNLYEGKFHQSSDCRIRELEDENAELRKGKERLIAELESMAIAARANQLIGAAMDLEALTTKYKGQP